MPVSEFRSAELMDVNSLGKESIFNDLAQNFSRGISGYLALPLGGLTALDLASETDDLSLYAVLRFTGALTAPCIVTAPSRARVYILENATTGTFSVTFKTSSGLGVTLTQGVRALYYSDSTEVYAVAGGEGTGLVVASANGTWNWDTATAGAPASGRIGINTTGVTAATELRLHGIGSDGVDREAVLRSLQSQDELYLQDQNTSANFVRYRLTAPGTDQGVWWSFPVLWVANGGAAFSLNQPINVTMSMSASLPRATTTQPGITVLADNALTIGGLDGTTAVTPASLQAKWATIPPTPAAASTTVVGVTRFATTAEGATGTLTTVAMTPQTVQAKINAIPLATDTVVGLVERATTPETLTGTDLTRYVSPASLQAKIDTLPVAPITGTPLSVLRIPSGGSGQEAAPGLLTTSDGWLGIGGAAPAGPLHVLGNANNILERNSADGLGAQLIYRKSRGTLGLPERLQNGDTVAYWTAHGYIRNATDTADAYQTLVRVDGVVDSLDAQGRAGGRVVLYTANPASGNLIERLRVTETGAVGIGIADPRTRLHLTNDTTTSGQCTLSSQRSALSLGHVLGGVEIWSNDTTLPSPGVLTSYLRASASQTHTAAALGSSMSLATTPNGTTTPVPALTIEQDGALTLSALSSVQERPQALLAHTWVSSVDATRTSRLALSAYDWVAAREGIRIEADGTAGRLSFYGATAVAKPTVTGSRGGNAALASVLTALSSLGLVTDSTTA